MQAMKKLIFILITFSLLYACSPGRKLADNEKTVNIESPVYEDGSSFEKAVVIHEKSESKGIAAEYAWIRANYPGSAVLGQSLLVHKRKPYDRINIKTSDGREMSIYFDISDFYGKF